MKHKSICALLLGLTLTACSDNSDDPKYRSTPPEISDMTLKPLDGSEELRAGTPIVATVTQSRNGRLLNRTDYDWTADEAGITHKFRKDVIYDLQPQNPTDTLVFEAPGTYKLTFSGHYRTSGNAVTKNGYVDIPDGRVTYSTPTFMYFNVTVEKTVRIN